jgi:hypothetical protein
MVGEQARGILLRKCKGLNRSVTTAGIQKERNPGNEGRNGFSWLWMGIRLLKEPGVNQHRGR